MIIAITAAVTKKETLEYADRVTTFGVAVGLICVDFVVIIILKCQKEKIENDSPQALADRLNNFDSDTNRKRFGKAFVGEWRDLAESIIALSGDNWSRMSE